MKIATRSDVIPPPLRTKKQGVENQPPGRYLLQLFDNRRANILGIHWYTTSAAMRYYVELVVYRVFRVLSRYHAYIEAGSAQLSGLFPPLPRGAPCAPPPRLHVDLHAYTGSRPCAHSGDADHPLQLNRRSCALHGQGFMAPTRVKLAGKVRVP